MLLTLSLTPVQRLVALGVLIIGIFLIAGVAIWIGRIAQKSKNRDEFDIQNAPQTRARDAKPSKGKEGKTKQDRGSARKQKRSEKETASFTKSNRISSQDKPRFDDFPSQVGDVEFPTSIKVQSFPKDVAGVTVPKRPQINISELRQVIKPSMSDDIIKSQEFPNGRNTSDQDESPFKKQNDGEMNW